MEKHTLLFMLGDMAVAHAVTDEFVPAAGGADAVACGASAAALVPAARRRFVVKRADWE